MFAHLTDTLTQLITNLYVMTGLFGIVLAMALESCCIPLPSEIVMPLAGIMIAAQRHLPGLNPSWPLWVNLSLVALAGAIGCLVGSIAAYAIGSSGGRPLLLKYGRYVLISQHDANKADQFFQRWGSATAFFSRLLPVVRTYISLPAGIAKMPFIKFCVYSFLGSFPWCLLLAYLGVLLGRNMSTLSPIFRSLDIVIAVAFVILVALYIWRHIRNDNKARAEIAEAEAMAAAGSNAKRTPQPLPNLPSSAAQDWNQQTSQPWQQEPSPWAQQREEARQSARQFQQNGEQMPPSQPSQQPQQGWPPQSNDDHTIRRR